MMKIELCGKDSSYSLCEELGIKEKSIINLFKSVVSLFK